MNFSTLCTILVTSGLVTPEIARVTTASFWTRQQKLAYPTEYLSNYYTDLRQPFSVSSHMYGDYKTDTSFAVAKGRCYGDQLIFDHFGRRQNQSPSLIVLKRNALTPCYICMI